MQDKRETADSVRPTAYQKGKMFYLQGLDYNPYLPDTQEHTDFYRGKLDAEEEEALYAEISSWKKKHRDDWDNTMRKVRAGQFNPSL